MPFLVRLLVDQIDKKELLAAHRLMFPKRETPETISLNKKLAKLKGQYDQGMTRFLSLEDSSIANDLQDRLEKIKADIAKLEIEIAEKEVPEAWTDVIRKRQKTLDDLRGKLVELRTSVSKDGKFGTGYTLTRASVRELFHRIGLKVELWFEKASAHRYRIVRGRVRAGGDMFLWDGNPAHFDGGASLTV